jgi:hypothetical protein
MGYINKDVRMTGVCSVGEWKWMKTLFFQLLDLTLLSSYQANAMWLQSGPPTVSSDFNSEFVGNQCKEG